MAAHQVALQIFWTLTYFVDPLFVAATSFIARDHGRRPVRVRRMAWLLMGLSLGVVGLALFTTSFCSQISPPTEQTIQRLVGKQPGVPHHGAEQLRVANIS